MQNFVEAGLIFRRRIHTEVPIDRAASSSPRDMT